MRAHTPGPWFWTKKYPSSSDEPTWTLVSESEGIYGILACDGLVNSPQEIGPEINARLIAAAPEMYELLKEVMVAFELEYELSAFKLKRISNLIQKIEGDK